MLIRLCKWCNIFQGVKAGRLVSNYKIKQTQLIPILTLSTPY